MSGAIRVSKIGDGPLWGIGCDYFSPKLIEHAKAVPGMRFEKEIERHRNMWVGYVDAVEATVARLEHVGLRIFGTSDIPGLDDWKTVKVPPFDASKLRPYQVDGVRFGLAKAHEGVLIADGMRLGKSCQTTVIAKTLKKKTLVLCPSHIVGVWSRPADAVEGAGEIALWWPDAWKSPGVLSGVQVLQGVKPFASSTTIKELGGKKNLRPDEHLALKAAEADIVTRAALYEDVQVIVCHYDIIYAWADVILEWAKDGLTLILDEVHILAGYQSRRSDAIKRIRAVATYTIGATGTPVTNKPKQTHNVLDIICPRRFGYFFIEERSGVYSKVFCDAKKETIGKGEEQKTVWNFDGRSNLETPDGKACLTKAETLSARLKHMTIRRLKKDVDPQLPLKERKVIDVDVKAKHIISVHSGQLDKGGKEFRKVLDAAADGKFDTCVDVVVDHLNEGEKVIAFCYRRAFTEELAKEIRRKAGDDALVEFVHGDVPQKERDRIIHKVKMHNGPAVLCGTIDSISTGIKLSFASVATFCELTWEPHEFAQAEERLYEFGVNATAFIEYIIARGTGDELILRAIIKKMETAEQTIGTAGDRMKEDLSAKRGDPMKRLYDALVQMQKVGEKKDAPSSTRRRTRRKT